MGTSVDWEWKFAGDETYLLVDFGRTTTVEQWLEVIDKALPDYESDSLKILCSAMTSENRITFYNFGNVINVMLLKGVKTCRCAYVTDDASYDFKGEMLGALANELGQDLMLRGFFEWQDAKSWLFRS